MVPETDEARRLRVLNDAKDVVAERLELERAEIDRLNGFMPRQLNPAVAQFIRVGFKDPSAERDPIEDRLERKISIARYLDALTQSPNLYGPRRATARTKARAGLASTVDVMQRAALKLYQTEFDQDDDDALKEFIRNSFGGNERRVDIMFLAFKRLRQSVVNVLKSRSQGSRHLRTAEADHVQAAYLQILTPDGISMGVTGNTGAEYLAAGGFTGAGIRELLLSYADHMATTISDAYDEALRVAQNPEHMPPLEDIFAENYELAIDLAHHAVNPDRQFTIGAFRGDYHGSRLGSTLAELYQSIPSVERAGVRRFFNHNYDLIHPADVEIHKQTLVSGQLQWILPITSLQVYPNTVADLRMPILNEIMDAFGRRLPDGIEMPDEILIPVRVNHRGYHWTGMHITVPLSSEMKQFFRENAGQFIVDRERGIDDRREQVCGVLKNAAIRVEHFESAGGGPGLVKSKKRKRKGKSKPAEQLILGACQAEIWNAVLDARRNYFPNMRNMEVVPVTKQAGTTCLDHAMWNIFLHTFVEAPGPELDSHLLRLITDTIDWRDRNQLAMEMIESMGLKPVPEELETAVEVAGQSSIGSEKPPTPAPEGNELPEDDLTDAPSTLAAADNLDEDPTEGFRPREDEVHSVVSAPVLAQPHVAASIDGNTSAPSTFPVEAQRSVPPVPENDAPETSAPLPAEVEPSTEENIEARSNSSTIRRRRVLTPDVTPPEVLPEPLPLPEPSPAGEAPSKPKRRRVWQPAEIRGALASGIDKYRHQTQRLFGSYIENKVWGFLTFMLMLCTLFIVHKPFFNHLRTNQLQNYVATDKISVREALVQKWGIAGRTAEKVSLNSSDARLLEQYGDSNNPAVVTLSKVQAIAIKALPSDQDDDSPRFRGKVATPSGG